MKHKAVPLPYPYPPERPRRASGHEPQGPAGGGCSRRWLLLLLLVLLAAWYLTPFALQGGATDTQSCSKRDPALCDDHGEVRQGRDHVVCVYADRVVKTVWAYVETRLA